MESHGTNEQIGGIFGNVKPISKGKKTVVFLIRIKYLEYVLSMHAHCVIMEKEMD